VAAQDLSVNNACGALANAYERKAWPKVEVQNRRCTEVPVRHASSLIVPLEQLRFTYLQCGERQTALC